MKISYDPAADAMYIYLSKRVKKSTRTEEVSDGVYVDFARNELLGIEVLDASKRFGKKDLDWVSLALPTYREKVGHSR
mgnify:CR=1 FL=1